ncbi:hypothetical protein [Streptomyces sp. NPDC002205]|uniref:hypothetical protein n=1 Tax=Streptomyces sp. NPDC002205 TaxID=3154411 RepID=UPI00332FD321
MQASGRGFADVLTMTFPAARALEARRTEAWNGFLELIARAENTDHLRGDFTSEGLVIILTADVGVIAATGDAAPDAWRRPVGQMLRAYATQGTHVPPPRGRQESPCFRREGTPIVTNSR